MNSGSHSEINVRFCVKFFLVKYNFFLLVLLSKKFKRFSVSYARFLPLTCDYFTNLNDKLNITNLTRTNYLCSQSFIFEPKKLRTRKGFPAPGKLFSIRLGYH